MNKIFKSKKVLLMVCILAILISSLAVISTWIDYQYTKQIIENSLVDIVNSEKENIENLKRTGLSKDSILSIYKNSTRHWHTVGETGAFAIGELKGDSIYVLFRSNMDYDNSIKDFNNATDKSPMKNALSKNSGFIEGIDCDKKEIFVAFSYIDDLKWGIVSKIHVSEIKNPFLRSLLITLIISFFLILIGALLFVKITNPMINEIIDSEQKFRALFAEHSNIMLLIEPDSGKIIDANKAACIFYGYDKELLCKMNIADLNTSTQEEILAEREKAKEKNQIKFEFKHRLANGEIRDVEVHSSPIQFMNKVYLFSIIQDISDKKQTEEKLASSEKRYRTLIETMHDGIMQVDNDDTIFFINDSFCNILGYSKEELLGKKGYEVIIHPEYRDIVLEKNKKRLSDESDSYVIKGLHRNGNVLWLKISGSPYKDGMGNIIGSIGLISDITEQKNSEMALAESEKYLRTIIDTTSDGFWVVGADKKFADVNKSYLDLSGYTREEFLELDINDIDADENPEETHNRILRIIKNGNELFETRHRKKDGTIFPVEISTTFIDGKLVCFCRDITERKFAEEKIRLETAYLEELFEGAPEGIALLGNDDKVIKINSEFTKIFGYTQEEVFLKQINDLIVPEELIKEGSVATRAVAAGERIHFDTIGRTKDGRIIDVSILGNPIKIGGEQLAVYGIYRDISERKKAENEIRKSEERLKTLIELAPDAFFHGNNEGIIIDANKKALELTGLEKDELLGKLLKELFTDDSIDNKPLRFDLLEGGETVKNEREILTKDGRIIQVEMSSNKMPDGTYQTFMRDITNRKKMMRQLEESEILLRTIIDNAPFEVWARDNYGVCILENKAIIDHWGSLLGKAPDYTLLTDEELDIWKSNNKRAMNGEVVNEEVTYMVKGRERYYQNIIAPLNIKNKIEGIVGFNIDITDSKKQVERIQLLADILDTTPASITVHDFEGNFLYANKRTLEYHGFSEREFYKLNLRDIDTPENAELIAQRIENLMKTGESSFEVEHFRKDGSTFPLLVNIIVIKWEGKDVLLSIANDISERKAAENALRESEEKYRQLFDSNKDGITIFAVNPEDQTISNFIGANDAAGEMLGYSKEELYSMKVTDFEVSEAIEENKYKRMLEIQEKGLSSFETAVRHKNGEVLQVDVKAVGILYQNQPAIMNITRNISDRKRAEKALSETTTRLTLATRAGGVGVWDWDCVENTLIWDDQMYALYGIEKDSFSGAYEAWRAGLHPEDMERGDKEAQMALSGEKEFDTEFRVVWGDGSVHFIQALAIIIRDADGNPLRMIGTNWDITENKRTEETIRKSEERLQKQNDALLTLMSGGTLFQSDIQKAIAEITEVSSAIIGTERVSIWLYNEDYSEIKCIDLYHQSDHQHSSGDILRCLEFPAYTYSHQQGKIIVSVDVYSDPRTSDIPTSYYQENGIASLMDVPVFISDRLGALLSFEHVGEQRLWTSEDVRLATNMAALLSICFANTERERAESALKRTEAHYRAIIENAPDGVVLLGAEGKLTYASPSARKLFGYEEFKLYEMIPDKYTHPDDLVLVNELLNKIIKEPDNILSLEYRFKHASGNYIWIESTFSNKLAGENLKAIVINFRVIEERKKAELGLIERENRLRSLFENSPIAIWEEDFSGVKERFEELKSNGVTDFLSYIEKNPEELKYLASKVKILSVNSKSVEVMGANSKEELIKNLPEYFTEDSYKVYIQEMNALWNGEMGFSGEIPVVNVKGEIRTLNINLSVVPGFEDSLSRVIISFIDITDKKVSEIAILHEKQFSDMLIESLPGIFYMFDSNFKPLRWNRNKALLLGLTDEQMKEHNTLDYIADADKARVVETFMQTFKEGYSQGDFKIVRHDEEELSYNLTGVRLDTAEGPLLLGVGIDINERVKAEQELKQKNDFIQTILDNLPIGVALNKINEGTATYMNKKFEEIYGWSRENLYDIVEFFNNVYPDEDYRNQLITQVMADIKSNDPNRMHWENIVATGKDGSQRVINCQNIPLFEQNTMVSTVIDISKQKKAEEELQKFTKMESLGVIAGGIAHNFKNILANISFSVSLAKFKPESFMKNIDKIEQAINQASALATRFQTFSKGGEPLLENISVKEVLDNVIKIAESGSANIIEFNHDHNLKNIYGDTNQLNEVFMNLVINANQAMPVGGKITINAGNISLNPVNDLNLSKGDYVKITFRDQGIGIPQDLLPKIFDPFFTTKTEGQGLGLSSVHYIIHKHKGIITVDSEIGKWTQFDIYLPASEEKILETKPELNEVSHNENKKILYMDDNELLRENMEEIAELLDFKVDTVANGEDAIQYYKEASDSATPYDVVILDLTIQGSTLQGEDVLTELKKIDPEVKAIVFSGHSTKPIVANYKEYGFKGRLDKPVTIDSFTKVLKDVCGG